MPTSRAGAALICLNLPQPRTVPPALRQKRLLNSRQPYALALIRLHKHLITGYLQPLHRIDAVLVNPPRARHNRKYNCKELR